MKRIIINILNAFGYSIHKIHKKSFFKKDVWVTVANQKLSMPSYNPLSFTYKQDPQFAQELARITKHIHSKYPNTTIIDIGANVGDSAIIMKTVTDFTILCIEGDAISFSYLQKNTKRLQNITLVNSFLGERNETISVKMEKSGWNNTIVPKEGAERKIDLIKLDSLLEKEELISFQNPHFLKIDTEGFDTIILRGAASTINRSHPILFIEYNRDNMETIGEDGLRCLYSLKDQGYEDVHFYDDRGRFVLATTLSQTQTIKDLHHYIGHNKGLIYYFNVCLFHKKDSDVAHSIATNERAGK